MSPVTIVASAMCFFSATELCDSLFLTNHVTQSPYLSTFNIYLLNFVKIENMEIIIDFKIYTDSVARSSDYFMKSIWI